MYRGTVTGITVTGTAAVEVRPDRAAVHLGVSAEAASAAEAMDMLATRVASVNGALRGAGLGDADIRTAHLSVGQRYDTTGTPDGHVASCATLATIRDLDAVGRVLDVALAAGASRVDGLSLEVSDPSAAYAEALALAIDAAREKARGVARAAGLELGAVEAVTEGGGQAGGPPVMMAEMRMGKGFPVEAGGQEVTASVTVRFATSSGSPGRP